MLKMKNAYVSLHIFHCIPFFIFGYFLALFCLRSLQNIALKSDLKGLRGKQSLPLQAVREQHIVLYELNCLLIK